MGQKDLHFHRRGPKKSKAESPQSLREAVCSNSDHFSKSILFVHIFANEVCGESEEFIIAGCHAACAV